MTTSAPTTGRRPLIMVLGMHRSGTSLCANMLAAMGVDMAEVAGPSPDNPRGHWERPRINDLHDEIFAMHGIRWSDPSHHLALPPNWHHEPAIRGIRARLAAYLTPLLQNPNPIGFKDPRTARVLPMWDQLLDELNLEPRYVFCIRDPAQVVRSITARDHTARSHAEYRWLIYNAHALHGVGTHPVCIIPYTDWFTAPLATARRLAHWIGATPDDATLQKIAAATIDTDLRHDIGAEPAGPAAQKLFTEILNASTANTQSPTLLTLAADFLSFERAITPLLREAVILKASVIEQNRVIADLETALKTARK